MNETQTRPATPTEESLRVQLTELNNRSRWYSSELWQVPFAYLALSCLVIGQAADKGVQYVAVAFAISSTFGVFAIIHMYRIRGNEQRAIKNLQEIEKTLNLPVSAQTRKGPKIFQIAVIFTVVGYAAAVIYLTLECLLSNVN